jgi:soluble lytic murein transglycosylase
MVPAILATGVARLAARSPRQGAEAIQRLAGRLVADPAAWDRAHRAVARALVEGEDASDRQLGLGLWDRVAATPANLGVQEERLRSAVRLGAWQRVADWVARLPECDEQADRWLYWLARAQAELGLAAESRASFERAAARRSLWGFLAADRLGLPYRLDHRPAPVEPELARALDGSPALARIRELRRLGAEADQRREWRLLTRDLDRPGLMAAATLAEGLDWPDQAIFTLARTGWWDDLKLRFPLRYLDLVQEQAWQSGVPEAWILAVIRQESVFAPGVASPAGALGLMQLMPATARQVARDPGLALPGAGAGLGRAEILDPATNIALGSTYLAAMRDRFGHPALATAAYNAGPHRVERWLPEACLEADRWILSIPFEETRVYVERVLAYRVIYGARLGGEPVRLAALLPAVAPRGARQVQPALAQGAGGGRG